MIRVLPTHVANKIAAGEVIERPASVVKELVENSLDAGARRILVEVEEGGKRLVRVTDDGDGMDAADLALAFAPHATSKIEDVEDLFQILSYGFRGEALASIGSVARASIFSRRRGEDLGHRVSCEKSRPGEVREAGGPEGTEVEIRDLFHDTPARRKFLKSDSGEIARITETLTRLVLPLVEIDLELRHNGRRVLHVEPAGSLEQRLVRFFGRDLEGSLLPVEGKTDGASLRGFIALPEVARGTSTRQFLYVNERSVRDRSLGHAVQRAYEGFLMPRRYPVWFIELTIDPELVDVNVHPAKAEVRFRQRNALFSMVQRAVTDALERARPMPRLELPDEAAAGPTGTAPTREAWSPVRGEVAEPAPRPFVEQERLFASPAPRSDAAPLAPPELPSRLRADEDAGRFMQIHASYILVEDREGFYIIDQHALHERMLFERLLAAPGEEGASQRLLVPEVIDLPPDELARLDAMRDELAAIGLVVSPFGGSSVAVEAVPVELVRTPPRRLLEAVIGDDEDETLGALREIRRDRLAHRACRAAVKFADRLDEDDVRQLIEWERSSPKSAACPHGRPTRVRITLAELERRFHRKE
ncbi:MAG: DNA mismatch repair endonuclease MutL [Planctomycetota bacterium]